MLINHTKMRLVRVEVTRNVLAHIVHIMRVICVGKRTWDRPRLVDTNELLTRGSLAGLGTRECAFTDKPSRKLLPK